MRAWAKRMIWFFGYSTLLIIGSGNETPGTGAETELAVTLGRLLILVLPLLAMQDDPEPAQSKARNVREARS